MDTRTEKLIAWRDGKLYDAWHIFGSHPGETGTEFTVWAPNARSVRVSGDFCGWDGWGCPLDRDESGVWSGFVEGAWEGMLYKYIVEGADGQTVWKSDPFALTGELRPGTASRICELRHPWADGEWMASRRSLEGPRNIYEVHLGTWRRHEDGSFLSYEELREQLVPYVADMGYTHVELLPVMEHPFDGSWGYQSAGYFAATSRYGDPEGLMSLIDGFHQAGIGVILDWVPGHFCRDISGLGRFDGTPLFDAGDMPGWGTYKFNFERYEVRSFLISSALFWLQVYHADGLRVDGVSSMLYLNFGVDDPRKKVFNKYGDEGNLAAISLLQEINTAVGKYVPGASTYAEESTAWPLVTYPPEKGGLGFHYKWDMGWMNDTLRYISEDFDWRRDKHGLLTFSMMYAFSENYILPMSHDEVVHGKRSLIGRMPGDWWRQFAGARLLQMYAACHPGGMLNFMGNEFAQFVEWRDYEGLEWFLLDYDTHAGVHRFVREMNHVYKAEKALWGNDHSWDGFRWIDADNAQQGVLSYVRTSPDGEMILCLLNFRPESRENWRIGVPVYGRWQEILSSDETRFGGTGKLNPQPMMTEFEPDHGCSSSLVLTVPPLGGTWIKLIERLPEPKPVVKTAEKKKTTHNKTKKTSTGENHGGK